MSGAARIDCDPTDPGARDAGVSDSDLSMKGRGVRSAILSTFPPRPCGIGVFSSDMRSALVEAPGIDDVGLLVVVDEPSSPQQTDVIATVSQSVRGDYVRAARLLGRLDVDVVLLQHEYGIYGGPEGEYVLSFARELSQPLVVTLHTLLSKPAPHQFDVLLALCSEAERVIVMTETARRLLIELRACPAEKIRIVPHGAPALLGQRRAEHAAGRRPVYVTPGKGGYEGMQARFLLSTFGLLSAGKGLETALEALPAIVERHPEVLYMIAGRTHPAGGSARGREVSLAARAPGGGPRPGGPRCVRRPLPVDRRARRLARRDGRLRDPVQKSRADRIGRAHLCACRRLCRRLDPLLVCRRRPRLGRRHHRAVRRPAGPRGCGLRLHRATGAARRRAAGSATDRLGAPLVVRGRGHRRRPPRGGCGRAHADADPVGRSAPFPGAYRSPAHAGGRRRDRAARVRRDPELEQRLLRRRRGTARRRGHGARAPRRSTSGGRRSSTARSPSSNPPRRAKATACATS